tara:strand:- start:2602 stop:9096 length:6495 start_codon:yes stop_codon:yes gene_type:complete
MTIEAQLADGRVLEFPDGTDPSVIQATVKRMLAPAPAKEAGFSLKDIGTAFGQGAVGSTEALANVAGAGNAASQYLGDVSESLGKQYTPERQAEMQRQQQRMKKAEESGSTWEEIKAAAQNIYEAPLQSAAQGLGSFVPYVPAIFAGPAAAALGLGSRAVAAANIVAKAYAPIVGTAQGAGSVKGAIYDAVYKAEKESGLSESEARQKATAAQDYTGKNLDQIALGAGLGYVASKGGVEKFLTKEGREKAAEKLIPRVTKAVTEESATEGAQGGQERLASNVALQRTGRDVPTFQGVGGQAAQDAITAALTAGAVSIPQSGKAPVEDLTKRASTTAGQEALDIVNAPPPAERVKDVEPVINPPVGAGVPVAGEREVVQPTEGAIAPEGVGVGTTVPPAVPAATGEGEQPAALNPDLQKIYDAYATYKGKTWQGSEDLATFKIKRLTDVANIHNQPINVWLHQGEIVPLGASVPKPKFARLIGTVNPTNEVLAAPEVVIPPQAPATLDIPEEVKEDKTLASQPTYAEGSVSEVPVSELKLSEDVPQFKSDANQAGVVQASKLEGKFDRRLASPIQVWQRDNGALEVISGRHRLDLAQRSGEKTIPAQIYKESEGFNADMARMLDIELNVKDGRGKVKDYVSFFKEFNLPKDQARSEGLLNTAIGRQAYEIADAGSPSLIAAHFNKEISDDAATSIAINAPKDDALQNLGMAQVKDGKSINHAVNFMRSAMAAGFKGQEGSGDLFGFDDSFAKEAEAVTKEATKQQRDARQQLAAIKGAAKSPEKAKLGGVDVKNLEQTKAKIAELEKTVNDLENFHTNPELYKKLRQDAGLEEGLTAPTPEELKAAEERAKSEESRIAGENKAAEDKAKADAEVDEFGLTGSDRVVDADPNQEAMFSLREATPEQMNEADAHAKDFGGAVVYQKGDIALVRAFSSLTGQPVYLVAKGDRRSRVDVESYTGRMISESEKQELIAEKKKIEAEDAKTHKKNPFIIFDKNGLSFSKGVPVQVGKVLVGWKDLLKLAPNIHITTVEDARNNVENYTGEHRAIGSVGLDYKQRGVMRQLPSGDYYIAFTKSTSITKMLETLAHELGHIHQREVFDKSSPEVKKAITEEYWKWAMSQDKKTAKELILSLRAKTTGKTTKVPDNLMAKDLTNYWRSFSEWYADQTAKWAITSEKPVGIVEKYFKRLGEALRSFYAKVRNSGYLPNETFKKYLDTVTKENIEQHLIVSKPEDQMSLFMKSEVEPVEIEKAGTEKGQEALDITGGLGRVSEKPDSSYMKQVREAWDNATDNPKATASEAKAATIKFIDLIQTKAFSSDAAINNSIRREVNEFVKDNEQAIGTMLNISQSQVVHADALANLFLTSGNLKYNKDLYKYEAVEDKSNIVELAKQLGEIKEKYGLTQAQTELIGHTAFEAKRLKSLLQFNNQVDQEVAEMRAEADKLAMDGKAVAAHALREKATRRSKETKFIHMTGAEISAGNKLFKVIPELNGVVDTWNQMRDNAANLLVDSGLWSKDEAEFLLSNADYVPFFREEQLEKGKGPKEYIRGLMVQAQEKKLKGSSKPVNDIFDNMNRWLQYSVNRAVRNRSALALIDTASEFGQAKRIESKSDGDNAIRVWRNGKEEFYDMADPMFVEAFTGLESISIPAWKWASTVANILRQSVVLNPLFTVAQLPQDSFAAMFTSGLKAPYALQIPVRAVKEFIKTLAHRSATNNELKKYGVVGVRDFTSQMARLDAQVYAGMKSSPGILGRLKSSLEHIAMAGDNAVRQATYEAATAQGLSKAEAIEKSFEIWNIRRKGTSQSLAIASQVIPFFGAYLAAQNVALKTISGVGTSPTERKAALGALVGTTASVMTLSLLYAMMNGDDEDYLKKPAAIRDRMLMVPGTNGFGIPLRSDIFSVPKIITEHMYLMMTDKGYEDGRKFRDSMKNALGNSFFSPTVVPQAIKPGLEVMVNYDFFQGRPLIGEYQKRLEKERQFNESTSEIAKILGNTGLVSPISADHLIRGMLGSAGGLIIYMTNPLLHSDPNVDKPTMSTKDMLATLPGASSFVSKEKESALKADFYVLRDEVAKVTNTLSDLKQRNPEKIAEYIADPDVMAKLTVSKGVQGIDKKLGEIRKAMTRISNLPTSAMGSDEKQQQIKQLREAETQMLKAINVKNLREMAKI